MSQIEQLCNDLNALHDKFSPLIYAVKMYSPKWKQLTKQHKEACEIAAINALENAKSEEVNDLAAFIYWQVTIVKSAVLSKYLGTKGTGIAKAIGAATFQLVCDNCGETFRRDYENRSQLEEDTKASNKYPNPMCDKCKPTFKLGKLYFDTLNEVIGYVVRHPETGAKGYDVFMYTDKQGKQHWKYYSRNQINEYIANGVPQP